MKLRDYLTERNIHLDLDCDGKLGFFREALGILHREGRVSEPERVLEDLRLREEIMSTGVGQGVAIPHAQSEGVESLHLSFWRPRAGLDFEAVDGRAVDLIFMILGPRDSEHVKILARISRLLHMEDFREQIRGAGSVEEVFQVLQRHDVD